MAAADAPLPKELIYIADPMCSWCWGFMPVITAIRRTLPDDITLRLVMGGHMAGNRQPRDRDMVLGFWRQVHETTGQPFNFTYDMGADFIYDSTNPCRAVVTLRNLAPDNELEFLSCLQRAFYVENADVTKTDVLAALAAPFAPSGELFLTLFSSDDMKQATDNDFALTRQLGGTGFPTLLERVGKDIRPLARGYCTYEDLNPRLEAL